MAAEVAEVYQDNTAEQQLSQIVGGHCEKQREAPYGERHEGLSLMCLSPTVQA